MYNLSIIIINYNTFAITCQCISSIYSILPNLDYEIILVDNGSTEFNSNGFIETFPEIQLVKSKENLGFSGGNNLGLKYAKGEFILLLNSDTILFEDCISPCIEKLKFNKEVGVVTPKLLNPDLSYQKNARKNKNIIKEVLDLFRPIIKQLPYKCYSSFFLNQYFKGDYDVECDWICGAFLMTRREIIDKLPNKKLDDRFFMYGEDALWCNQVRDLGYSIEFLYNYSLIHIGNVSTSKESKVKLQPLMIDREVSLYKLRGNNIINIYIFMFILRLKQFIYHTFQ